MASRRARAAAAPAAPAADTIALVGSTPQGLQRGSLGIFKKRPEAVNGWPLYRLEGSDGVLLWHAERSWFVGPAGGCGQDKGFIGAFDGALRPELVQATWKAAAGDAGWHDAPELRVIAGEVLASALAAAAETIALVGPTPECLQRGKLGIFKKRPEAVNGWPSYRLQGSAGVLLWHAGRCWYVGAAGECGQDKGFISARDGCLRPELVQATWEVWNDNTRGWLDAPELRCSATWEVYDGSGKRWVTVPASAPPGSRAAAAADDEVAVVGERTRDERDRLGRKHAIDLEETPCKRRKGDVEARVATARSLCSAESDARYKRLVQPALDEFADDKISVEELVRRKQAARDQAAAENGPLQRLDAAFAAYTAAAAARAAAESAEDEAATELEAAISAIRPGGEPGSSGVVKAEASPELA